MVASRLLAEKLPENTGIINKEIKLDRNRVGQCWDLSSVEHMYIFYVKERGRRTY